MRLHLVPLGPLFFLLKWLFKEIKEYYCSLTVNSQSVRSAFYNSKLKNHKIKRFSQVFKHTLLKKRRITMFVPKSFTTTIYLKKVQWKLILELLIKILRKHHDLSLPLLHFWGSAALWVASAICFRLKLESSGISYTLKVFSTLSSKDAGFQNDLMNCAYLHKGV